MDKIPQHIAIIMDGNRRWAKAHGKPVYAGHQFVANELLERLVEHADNLGIKYITFWAWSTENWARDKREVSAVMRIFKGLLERNMQRLHQKGVKIRVIGNLEAFPESIKEGVKKGIEQTKNNKKITAIFALNYGGRDEILRAINNVISDKRQEISEQIGNDFKKNAKQLLTSHFSPITENEFARFLDTRDFPDPELIIRTGGEKRLSGFLLWQSEYSEFYFTDTMMPDFDESQLDAALEDYSKRKRRFGK
jgi:undecaprenyl diphosphate synthase